MTQLTGGSIESMVESVKITRTPHKCIDSETGYVQHEGAYGYTLHWTEPDGKDHGQQSYYCPHPICDRRPLLLRHPRTHIVDSAWLPKASFSLTTVATVYILVIDGEDPLLPEVVGRIGICSQWDDPVSGNYGAPGERRLFSQRYWAESGPGVYPVPIEDEKLAVDSIPDIYGDTLDKVFEAWKATL